MSSYVRASLCFFLSYLLVLPSSYVYAQQSNLQLSMMAPAGAAVTLAAIGFAPEIADIETDSYLNTVTKLGAHATFEPTASDLKIQKAEDIFQNGKRYYQLKDTAHARAEFDAAVDLMLQASENPSDRQLYENKLEQMVDSIHRLDLAGLGASADSEEPRFEKAPLDDIVQMTFPVDPTLKNKVLEQVKATASQLPLEVNDVVLGYINYFSGRGRKTMVAGLERAGRYRAMIEKVLDEEGVPQELINLAQAESGFIPRAVSYRAAGGMWQFVAWRGRQYGLNQSAHEDERFDFEKATRAAARHLHDLYNRYGNWYLAISAYNCGPGVIDRGVERTGYADYWELRSRKMLPNETMNYVPIILAMTIMTKNAAEYGLTGITPDPPIEYDTVEITSATHLALAGDLTDTPVSQLLELNPALLRSTAPAGYSLRVPKGSGQTLSAALETVPEDRRASWRMHRVEAGETLASIAKHFGARASSIAETNHLATDEPLAGERLLIPAAYHDDGSAESRVAPRSSRHTSRSSKARSSSAKLRARPANRRVSHRAPSRSRSRVIVRRASAGRRTSGTLAELHRNKSFVR